MFYFTSIIKYLDKPITLKKFKNLRNKIISQTPFILKGFNKKGYLIYISNSLLDILFLYDKNKNYIKDIEYDRFSNKICNESTNNKNLIEKIDMKFYNNVILNKIKTSMYTDSIIIISRDKTFDNII